MGLSIKKFPKSSRQVATASVLMVFVVLCAACSSTKEMRRANRASKKLAKLTIKYPELLVRDTLRDTVPAIVTDIRTDTTFILRNEIDTLYLEKDRLRVRTIFRNDTVIQEAECLGDTIYVPIEMPCDKVQPVQYVQMPLKWWQLAFQSIGMLSVLLLAIWLAIRTLKK